MLLVHDGQAEALEADRLLDERVGPHHAARRARAQRLQALAPSLAARGIGEQRDLHAQRSEQASQGHRVLLGEDLGGGHQGRLIAGLDGGEHGQAGHHRLARAHVALEQTVHGIRRRQVRANLLPYPLLRAGEGERERGTQPARQLAGRVEREPGAAALAVAANGEPHLEQEEVVEHEPSPPVRLLGVGGGEVADPQRFADGQKPPARQHRGRQRLGHRRRVRIHQALLQDAKGPLVEAGRARVHGDEAAGVERLVFGVLDDLVIVHAHLEGAAPAIRRLDLAVHDEALAALDDAREVSLPEEDRPEEPRGVPKRDEEGNLRPAPGRRAHPCHRARARARLGADRDTPERGELAAILVSPRQVEERVRDGVDSELGVKLGALGADASEELQGGLEILWPRRGASGQRRGAGRPRRGRGGGGCRALPLDRQSVASPGTPCYKRAPHPTTSSAISVATSKESACLSVVTCAGRVPTSVTGSATRTMSPPVAGCPISCPCGARWPAVVRSACACAPAASRRARSPRSSSPKRTGGSWPPVSDPHRMSMSPGGRPPPPTAQHVANLLLLLLGSLLLRHRSVTSFRQPSFDFVWRPTSASPSSPPSSSFRPSSRLCAWPCRAHPLPGCVSTPSPHAADERPAPGRDARSDRGRRTAGAGTRPAAPPWSSARRTHPRRTARSG